ncbi:TetR/AcrR family transcriptional regulator [Streptomyces sp. 3N207]|uniref:TetR/AcrR family transcriptional regulator n=1 Tax=Streptomyces sp. 3N207 TaxID=3457417 RepID=UPI003FD36B64
MPREVRERQMLDAAVAAFARQGYQAASMDDIAEAAGVSKPLVYLYLKSKEDLFMACVRREVGALVAAVREGTRERGLTADQQLWNGLTAFFAHTAARPDGVAVLYRARTQGEPFAREVAAMRVEVVTIVRALLGQAARDAGCDSELAEREVSGLAHALVGAAESLAEWANSRTPAHADAPSARETAATLMNFCWAGLENLMKGRRWALRGAEQRG